MPESRFPDAPDRIRSLPLDSRGFPVPWFVDWDKGEPVFPAMDPANLASAIRNDLCWVCGGKLGRHRVYVIGPMCVANGISSEPPSHLECAEFAARNCPFLANPNMKRVPRERYGGCDTGAGVMIPRNPGVTALVTSEGRTRWFRDGPGVLFRVEPISRVQWFACGREATRREVEESFDSGLPALQQMAEAEGRLAVMALERRVTNARALFPAEGQPCAA